MLKALELVGFKSFADKTRFEFPKGITVVVGPNGSGKSNVVDAIKWVLGEQSVKSLRGKEMADVIFNGSASRRPLNSAETTLTLDNSRFLLPIDTPEVHITRRVYRSGEGEYLINRQPCRLRDIRELFWGTGVGTEAYSVIEQGKVDGLLQSSARDRRMIFEEAAGISRFKNKKIEAQRRLERVEQNLVRLSDIVDEVESRLRGVRAQASKARRYKEYADRLQGLRTQVGLADWRTLTEKLESFESELDELRQESAQASANVELIEAQVLEIETEIARIDELIRTSEARIAENRERLAALESTIAHERAHSCDLDDEINRHRQQLAAMSHTAGSGEQQLADALAEVEEAELAQAAGNEQLSSDQRAAADLEAERGQLATACEQHRRAHLEAARASAGLTTEIASWESQIEATRATREQADRRHGDLTSAGQLAAAELEKLKRRQQELVGVVEKHSSALAEAQARVGEYRRQHLSRQKELTQFRQRHSGATERASVLEELEKRLEGIGSGVKELLSRAKQDTTGPFKHVHGLVADLLHVSVEAAMLIEIALGDKAQHLVVDPGGKLMEDLVAAAGRLSGRVGFVPLAGPTSSEIGPILQGRPGVLGRADQFVEAEAQFQPLAQRLLGHTWIVETLSRALALSASEGHGLSFVTLAGELLAADGTLAAGPPGAATGLISRRSELRALRRHIAELEGKINEAEQLVAALERQQTDADSRVHELSMQHLQAVNALAEHRLKVGAAEERHSQIQSQIISAENEAKAADRHMESAVRSLTSAQQRLNSTDERLKLLDAALAADTDRLSDVDHIWQALHVRIQTAQVELAKGQQRLDDLRALRKQYERAQEERQSAITERQDQLDQAIARSRSVQAGILKAETEIAELYLRKEGFANETAALFTRRDEQRASRAMLAQDAQKIRNRLRKFDEKLHKKELAAGEIRLERANMADRLREDYGIELAEMQHQPTAEEEHEREAVEREIADLRQKLSSIGGVNLDALEELEELEKRHASLTSQFQDLTAAKNSLVQIIGRINADSRRLFAETLEAVRGHFQSLFRKLFGGGQADILLEEGVDILDSGIELVARPPGKELRSISLLSGGEKTLTCVALLLAIFRSRPSPFCVLDEVDAALDEANIGRFIGVLHEFLAWTQFIVVTHSKKTMTAATTLYGVTMQESGVSKRVSVRFDDVSEDGEIRANAAESVAEDSAGSDETAAA